jgi:hydroxylaminobenzene mutase
MEHSCWLWARCGITSLSPRAKIFAFWIALYGTYVNWFVTTLAAIFGTAALSPVTAAGRTAPAWQESLITAGFMSVGIAIIAASFTVLWGLRASAQPS